MHESKKQKPIPLKVLLDDMEKANKYDVHTYTVGHLNYNNLYKPKILFQKNIWSSNQEPKCRKIHISVPTKLEEKVNLMKNSLANFAMKTSLFSSCKDAMSMVQGREESNMQKLRSCSPIKTQFADFFQEDVAKDSGQRIKERTKETVLKDELELPDLQLLKFKPVGARRIGIRDSTAEYHFLPSYLAGLTKTDQFKILKCFNKDYLKKEDLLKKEITRHTIAKEHEKILMKELLKLGDIRPLHFKRLKVFNNCFEDVCNNSVIFGDILRKIKNAYDLYLDVLLDFQPGTQCKTFLVKIQNARNRTMKTIDVSEAMKNVKELEQNAIGALDINEELRNNLEEKMLKSQPNVREEGVCSPIEVQESTEKPDTPSLEEQFLFKKYQILALWDEIQELKKEITENTAFTGDAQNSEESLSSSEARVMKLQASNKFLQRACRDLDSEIQKVLSKQKITSAMEQDVKHILKKFLSSSDDG